MPQLDLTHTLFDLDWLKNHESELKSVLPDTPTHMQNFDVLPFGYRLKLMGIDWRSPDDLAAILVHLTKIGIIQQVDDVYHIRANPNSIFRGEHYFVA